MLQNGRSTDIAAQRNQSPPTVAADVGYGETLWLRGESQINDRQVLPIAMIAHIETNGSAAVTCGVRIAILTENPYMPYSPHEISTLLPVSFFGMFYQIAPPRRHQVNCCLESHPSTATHHHESRP